MDHGSYQVKDPGPWFDKVVWACDCANRRTAATTTAELLCANRESEREELCHLMLQHHLWQMSCWKLFCSCASLHLWNGLQALEIILFHKEMQRLGTQLTMPVPSSSVVHQCWDRGEGDHELSKVYCNSSGHLPFYLLLSLISKLNKQNEMN